VVLLVLVVLVLVVHKQRAPQILVSSLMNPSPCLSYLHGRAKAERNSTIASRAAG